jgi:hypothetical protein
VVCTYVGAKLFVMVGVVAVDAAKGSTRLCPGLISSLVVAVAIVVSGVGLPVLGLPRGSYWGSWRCVVGLNCESAGVARAS